MKIYLILSLLLWACLPSQLLSDDVIVYKETADNPSYSKVLELEFSPYQHKISYGEDPNQFGLLWSSEQTLNNDTLVVLIHGGCWLTAYDIVYTYPMATAIHQAGFSVWSLEYRRSGESGGGWPSTYDDIKLGIQSITKLKEKGITPSRILIAGHSAGGHLALLAGRDIAQLYPATEVDIIGLAAITNIKRYAAGDNGCQKAGLQFMGASYKDSPELYNAANPINYSIDVPVVLMHGEIDPIVPREQATAFESKLLETVMVANAGHFDWAHPGTPAFNRFLEILRTLTQTKPLE